MGVSSGSPVAFLGVLLASHWLPCGYHWVSVVFLGYFEAPWALLRSLGVLLGLSWTSLEALLGFSWSGIES